MPGDPATKWKISPLNEQLKLKAKAAGLWNLWLPADLKVKLAHLAAHAPKEEAGILLGPGLSNLVSILQWSSNQAAQTLHLYL